MHKQLLLKASLIVAMLLGIFVSSPAWLLRETAPPAQRHTATPGTASPGTPALAATTSFYGCPVFPANNIWNYDISNLPVDANSAQYINSMGLNGQLYTYFGNAPAGADHPGIPFVAVPASQPYVPVTFNLYPKESDPGPYPIPPNAPIEDSHDPSSDRHVLVIDKGTCELYEMWQSYLQPDNSWIAGLGATWDLQSNHLRPLDWGSADAAGLPIFPGLIRYEEVASGVITHALRVTTDHSQCAFLWPARHYASTTCNPDYPPMGLRLRLKASVDISSFPPDIQVILTALKHYGMFVADNDSVSWDIYGPPNPHWNNNDLASLSKITGSDFEAVDESALQLYPNSGEVNPAYLHATSTSQDSSHQSIMPQLLSLLLYPQPLMDFWHKLGRG